MEELILQYDARHGHFTDFVKSQSDCMTLGRSFKNDVVLSDHFVAPEQLRFFYENDAWKFSVLDNINPVLLNGKPVAEAGQVIRSGDKLTVGRTRLTLILGSQELERTRKLMLSNWMYRTWPRRLFPPVMLLIATLIFVFNQYQTLSSEVRWGQLASSGLGFILMAVIWAGLWALIGRLFRHQANFLAQLFYSALMMACLGIGMLFSEYPEYIAGNAIVGTIIEWGVSLLILSLLLRYNLLYASDLKRRGWIAFSVVAVLLVSMSAMSILEQRDFSTTADYSAVVKPPLAKWSADISVEAYLHKLALEFENIESSTLVVVNN
ncbi:MAG: FHA domain-containing protein [Gammaproteobacteria bacterium]|nr:FHA domain-containing protein [Gammaproteobacteria bacterium]